MPIVVDRKGAGEARPGDLAVVSGRRGRARVQRVLGSAKQIENVLEALLVERGARQSFEPHDAPAPSLEGRVDLRAERAFSTYVPGRVAPMLPPDLSEDLCSLRPREDRLCVTVEIPLEGGEPSFYRSVIRSRERLTYGHAEEILAGRERAEADLTEALKRAEAVSTGLRERRFARGALRVESPEIEFEFDSNGGVARAWRAERIATRRKC